MSGGEIDRDRLKISYSSVETTRQCVHSPWGLHSQLGCTLGGSLISVVIY